MSAARRSSRIARRTNPKNSSDATNNQQFNELQLVNKMPPELLGYVFHLGEGIERGSRTTSLPYKGFQDLVTRVCRHWRAVAINTPSLWTYIHISRPPPHPLAQLYISRSGACPLVIDIEMRTSYIHPIHRFDYEEQALRLQKTLELVAAYGGTVDRWEGFILLSKVPQAVFEVIQLLGNTPSPSLRFLSLWWKGNPDVLEIQAEDAMDGLLEQNVDQVSTYSLRSGPLRPQLQRVELNGLPNQFIFDRSVAMFSGLVKLSITSLNRPPSIGGLATLLSANPRLELLCVDMGLAYDDSGTESASEGVSTGPPQVQLPFLQYFLLDISLLPEWGLRLLQVIDAPGLRSFQLTIQQSFKGVTNRNAEDLFQFLGSGRTNGVLQTNVPPENEHASGGPIFPRLQSLEAEGVIGEPLPLRRFLGAFPTATEISLCVDGLVALEKHPNLFPNLSLLSLVVESDIHGELRLIRSVLNSRANSGMRLKTLDLNFHKPAPWLSATTPTDENYPEYQEYISPILQAVDKLNILPGVMQHRYEEAFDTEEEISTTDDDSALDHDLNLLDDLDEMDTEEDEGA